MSTAGKREFRPKIHFTPVRNWNNDPNGLVCVNGVWHLYYQHYPNGTYWGPMHWGHASSTDLLHWTHLPVALYPDELGMIFSGSMAYDRENTSGFGDGTRIPMVAVYTIHNKETDKEEQGIAYSLDGGLHFEKHYGNPVIANPGIVNFRDPKVFRNEKKQCWSMILAAEDRAFLYASEDLKSWRKTGEFGKEENQVDAVWECTDLFPVVPEGEEEEKWVLLASMTASGPQGKPGMQYFVGDFDGETFRAQRQEETLWMDFGFDCYAGVTWGNCDRPVFIAWGVNPEYAAAVPTGEYSGMMTLPRELSLVRTPQGYRLRQRLVGIDHLRACSWEAASGDLLLTESFGLQISGTQGEVRLENESGQRLRILVEKEWITVDRTEAGEKGFSDRFSRDIMCRARTRRLAEGDVAAELLFDVSYLEVFADRGLETASLGVYPDSPYKTLYLEGDLRARMYRLQ
ncbi:MAG: glycoside hydrolase family 32 protein [Eubacteriales bacterium]|nr:glycoside hydrolase family 32 protein [Eubacteriales bacterium]